MFYLQLNVTNVHDPRDINKEPSDDINLAIPGFAVWFNFSIQGTHFKNLFEVGNFREFIRQIFYIAFLLACIHTIFVIYFLQFLGGLSR